MVSESYLIEKHFRKQVPLTLIPMVTISALAEKKELTSLTTYSILEFFLPGFICHLTQVLLNTDTSLISIIISKREKERIHSTKCIKGLWKNPNGQPIRGHDFVYLPSWSLCWSPFTLGFRNLRNRISNSSYPRPITQFNFIMSELGP